MNRRLWLVVLTLVAAGGVARLEAGDDAAASELRDPSATSSSEEITPPPLSNAEAMPPELRRIQRSLGGPIADRFPTLESREGELDESPAQAVGSNRSHATPGIPVLAPVNSPLPATDGPTGNGHLTLGPLPGSEPAWNSQTINSHPAPAGPVTFTGSGTSPAMRGSQRRGAAALREAAAGLDNSANRLETLELYRQADTLRSQAQRLRVDARVLLGHQEFNQPISGEPTPSDGGAPLWEAPVIIEQRPDLPLKPRRFGMRVGPEVREAEAPDSPTQ